MRIRNLFVIPRGVALILFATIAAAQAGTSAASSDLDSLVKVRSKRFDEVYVRTGTDFRGYRSVMLDPTQVTFAGNWVSDMNSQPMSLMQATTVEDADQIAERMGSRFKAVFASAFKSAGYKIVAAPGADVLQVSLRLTDLSINAPETVTVSMPRTVYTLNAGEATLALEVRDSATGVLLWRVVDRRTAGDRGSFRSSFMVTTPVSNGRDFEILFDLWAHSCVKSLGELKAQPPMAIEASPQ
jgi:hypothetical protein